jgi:flavin reductase (DIM6/NTAB) family NADH-FMN oxidoreductase RutF
MKQVKFKDAMAQIPTNVSIIGSLEADNTRACTISSLVSVDIVDPTVMFVLKNDSATLTNIKSTLNFSINVLSSNQSSLSEMYSKPRDKDAVLNYSAFWSMHAKGVPIIIGAHLYFLCEYLSSVQSNNATIVLARVNDVSEGNAQNPLLYFDRNYYGLTKSNSDAH